MIKNEFGLTGRKVNYHTQIECNRMGWGEEVVNRWSTEHIWGSESTAYYNSGCKITADGDCSHAKMLAPWKECYDKPRQCIKKLRHHFAEQGPYSQGYGFSSSHVQI